VFGSFFNSFAQVYTDLGVDSFKVTDLSMQPTDAQLLPLNGDVILRLPIYNINGGSAVPVGTSKLKIGLGSKMVLDYPDVYAPTIAYSNYFKWTAEAPLVTGGQWQIVGDPIQPIPAGFSATIDIKVKGSLEGASNFTTNYLISNHASSFPGNLSDENTWNNSTLLPYRVITVTPVQFKSLNLTKKRCSVQVNFTIDNELNLDHYEVEVSKDLTVFQSVAQLAAKGKATYSTSFALTQQLNSPKLLVRIKSVDKNGQVKYSETKAIGGTCEVALKMRVFPNPASGDQPAVIIATQGLFNGKYKVTLRDMVGQQMSTKEMPLTNAIQFNYPLTNLANGKYLLQVDNTDGSQSATLELEKIK
jgi:hypothetical protein